MGIYAHIVKKIGKFCNCRLRTAFKNSNLFTSKENSIKYLCILTVVFLVTFSWYTYSFLVEEMELYQNLVFHNSEVPGKPGYLVWSSGCKMKNIYPYLPEVKTYFSRQKYEPCSTIEPLTRVRYSETRQLYILEMLRENITGYNRMNKLDCCYQSILRDSTGPTADENIKLGACVRFQDSVELSSTIDNILVKCYQNNKQVYINGHPMMPERENIRERLQTWSQKSVKIPTVSSNESFTPSVLMLGIDSVSRTHLLRSMPKTSRYLYHHDWFEMSGYNKINDNTYPNLMAILTGMNETTTFRKCSPYEFKGLEKCSFIWDTFREHGYVTAFAEDQSNINTFNYKKFGFERPPTDYYLRPFLLSAEQHLHTKWKNNLVNCIGYQHSADYVYDYALQLTKRYKNKPFFGLFWTNTFSHNSINDCSAMDDFMLNYLRQFASSGTLNTTIVIFFSDHGIRFGPTRKSLSGYIEERLPFMFIWLPPFLRQQHPEFVNALRINRNRLTNPYDIHMMLKHVLQLTGRVQHGKLLQQAEDCANCQTLLRPVPQNRSCADIAIEDHWCTCVPYESIDKNSELAHKLANKVVGYINDYVANIANGSISKLCARWQVRHIEYVVHAQYPNNARVNESMETYRIVFIASPGYAQFEATVRYNDESDTFDVSDQISRLDFYAFEAECINIEKAKKYCYC